MTARGQPDQSRSARYVLKDYVKGRLLYCHAPPNLKQEEFHVFAPRVRPELVEENLPKQQQRALRVSTNFVLQSTHCTKLYAYLAIFHSFPSVTDRSHENNR